MKHMVYQSGAKIAMLADQLKRGRGQWEFEADIDLRLAKARARRTPRVLSDADKLDDILAYLDKEDVVGTVDDPKHYFRATMNLSWGNFGGHWSTGDLVYFSGTTPRTVLGLGGSVAHVIQPNATAMPPGKSVFTPMSYTPYIMDALNEAFPVDMDHAGLYPSDDQDEADRHMMNAIVCAHDDRHGPTERMEFVARRLFVGKWDHNRDDLGEGWVEDKSQVVLGTPLYVALAD
jgi:hypothetical protein